MSGRAASKVSLLSRSLRWLSSICKAAVELEQAFSQSSRRRPTSWFVPNVGFYGLLCVVSHALVGLVFGHDAIQNAAGIWLPAGFSVYLRWRVGPSAYPVVFVGEMMSGPEIGLPFNCLQLGIVFGVVDVAKLSLMRRLLSKDKIGVDALLISSIGPSIISGCVAISACRLLGFMADTPFHVNLWRWVIGDLVGLIVWAAVISTVVTVRRPLFVDEVDQMRPMLISNVPLKYRKIHPLDFIEKVVDAVLYDTRVDTSEPLGIRALHARYRKLQKRVDTILYRGTF